MKRAYYSSSITNFLIDPEFKIIGELASNHSNRTLEELQINAWKKQIQILKDQLKGMDGEIYFEFSIPRMGKRVDNILIMHDVAFIIEFKVGDSNYSKNAIEQVIDYTVDLKNFHEGSHDKRLIPVLVATNASKVEVSKAEVINLSNVVKANSESLIEQLVNYINYSELPFNVGKWENSIYKPTPTIVEAAKALYKGHDVMEITRSDSGAINLSKTSDCISSIIKNSKANSIKSICFVTGVPGAGKTLAGLNIAVERMKADEDEHAVFLSGNGPLVQVLREALTRDQVASLKEKGIKITKKQAAIKANAFIQNIHHFRDDNMQSDRAPVEKVVVFDEAQRAWNNHQVSAFMRRKKGIEDFNMSEPEFLIDVMNRHKDWCTIICLVGGGQEINTGEAGLEEWIISLRNHFPEWNVYYSESILNTANYLKLSETRDWLRKSGDSECALHLGVSIRSFRSEKLSSFIHELLEINVEEAKSIFQEIQKEYPIVLTRNLKKAKAWLRTKSKGSERTGIIASSGARRLRALGIDVKNEISAPNWFLNDKTDIRSSYFLEDVATEFDIQGLEIDWALMAWGANFHMENDAWKHKSFKGSKWQNINQEIDQNYLKNTYRVLLTRARQGIVIYLPKGSSIDHTRPHQYYDGTFNYLIEVGIPIL